VVDGEHPQTVINQDVARLVPLPEHYLRDESARQLEEIERRRRLYLAGHPPVAVAGCTAIVIDDGIATGATVRAALLAIRRRRPERLVLAVPVAPGATIEALRADVDEVVCLDAPIDFAAISQFYADFHQVPDDEVIALLQRARAPRA
jgi:putative phosphoribosyl transferase